MSRIKSHKQFLVERDLSQEVDQVVLAEMLLEYYNINEGKALDTLKNSVSKALLGPFSRLSVIDTIRKGNLDIQKEIITKQYDVEDEVLDLEGKIDDLRSKGASRNDIARIRTQIERKNKEFRSFVKMKREQMNKGMKLLEKTIGKNPRRKEYYEAGFIDDKYDLAKFEYELAQKKSSDQDSIKKLKSDLETASKKAESFASKTKESSKKEASIKDADLGDLSQIRKNVGSKDLGVVVSLREKSRAKIKDLKSSMSKVLSDIKSFMSKSPSYDEVQKSGKISNGIKDLEESANELDSLENLVSVYSNVISNKGKDLSNESSLTSLFSKINNAINDGNDAGSGITKEVIDLKSDITLKKVGNLIKKLA
jgi:hypothetical protein